MRLVSSGGYVLQPITASVFWHDRSAREAEERENHAISKGETLPTEQRFDSNCITPGTDSSSVVLMIIAPVSVTIV